MSWLWWRPSSVLWGIQVIFKAINTCTDIYSLSTNFAGRPHRHVPWPADIQFTILGLEIGTLCVVVFTSMTTVSIADEDPRVVHGSVVLIESLLLWWTWNCIFPCRDQFAPPLLGYPTLAQKLLVPSVASHSVSNGSRDLGKCCECKSHQHARSPALPTLDAEYSTQHRVSASLLGSFYNLNHGLSRTWKKRQTNYAIEVLFQRLRSSVAIRLAFFLFASSQTTVYSVTVWRSFKWLLLLIFAVYYYLYINSQQITIMEICILLFVTIWCSGDKLHFILIMHLIWTFFTCYSRMKLRILNYIKGHPKPMWSQEVHCCDNCATARIECFRGNLVPLPSSGGWIKSWTCKKST